MKFKEIDLSAFGILEKCPIEISVIFEYDFFESEMTSRYQLIEGPNFKSYAYYDDFWKFIENWKNDKIFDENGNHIQNLQPYKEAYSFGFNEGYFEFENEIKDIHSLFQDNYFLFDKIFSETLSKQYAFTSCGYFYPNNDHKQKPLPILKTDFLIKGGRDAGRKYKAWYYIIHNPKPFIPIFRAFYGKHYQRYENIFRERNTHIPNYCTNLQAVIDEIEKDLSQLPTHEKTFDPEIKTGFKIEPKIIDPLFEGLKSYFDGREKDLKELLSGENISKKLYFKSTGNKLTDVFYRLHENGEMILNNKQITAKWICDNFENLNQKTKQRSEFKYDVVYKQLTNKSGGIDHRKRICRNL